MEFLLSLNVVAGRSLFHYFLCWARSTVQIVDVNLDTLYKEASKTDIYCEREGCSFLMTPGRKTIISTVGARIPNKFGLWMAEGICILNSGPFFS